MKLKKANLLILILALSLTIIVGCQNKQASETKSKIKIAASPTPHAQILTFVKEELKTQGYELEIVEFSDYVQPNLVVDANDMDANFFQHKPYLDNFNEEKNTKLVSAGQIHYEPLGIYAGKSSDLSNIPQGGSIAVPNDTTNEARALLLLQANGVIKIKDNAGLAATKNDIIENPHNLEIIELEAAQIPRVIKEVDFVVLNGNYAIDANLNVKDAVAIEKQDSEAAKVYANILAVKEGNENRDDIKALLKALKSDSVKQFIKDTYNGAVVAID